MAFLMVSWRFFWRGWCFCGFLWWFCSWLMVYGCLFEGFLDCLLWWFFDGFWWFLPFQYGGYFAPTGPFIWVWSIETICRASASIQAARQQIVHFKKNGSWTTLTLHLATILAYRLYYGYIICAYGGNKVPHCRVGAPSRWQTPVQSIARTTTVIDGNSSNQHFSIFPILSYSFLRVACLEHKDRGNSSGEPVEAAHSLSTNRRTSSTIPIRQLAIAWWDGYTGLNRLDPQWSTDITGGKWCISWMKSTSVNSSIIQAKRFKIVRA